MKQVIDAFRRKDIEKKLHVLRLEIDYELVTLLDALREEDEKKIKKAKEKLEKYRLELLRLNKQ